jgi:hypothetical protein
MVSESMDRKLPFYQRIGIRMHQLMCKLCSRYRRQLSFLRETIRLQAASSEDIESAIVLPPGARERIKRSIRNALNLK